jgi:phosphonate transport system substrate-binding protein
MSPLAKSLLVALCLAAPWACSSTPYPEVVVNLSERPAPVREPSGASAESALRFSVAAIQSPQDTHAAYSRFFGRMGHLLGREIRFVQRRTYAEVDDLLIAGQLDAALICTGGYLDLERRAPGAVEVLAVPFINGQTTYRSLLIVPASSKASSLRDLAGGRFAYADELSFSGHLFLVRQLADLGADPAHFFSSAIFTRSHDRAIEAVAKGIVDGAAVDSLIYESLVARDPAIAEHTRVIERSPLFGLMPVVVSTKLPAEIRVRLRQVLLDLSKDPEAAAALRAVNIERFAVPTPGLYDAAAAAVGPRK